MDKTRICRELAENLEPLPTLTDEFNKAGHFSHVSDSNKEGWALSPLGFWEWWWDGDPQPVHFFESEDAAARLLEAMPNPYLHRITIWFCGADTHKHESPVSHEDRRTAIVLAACKWLGIEVGPTS